MSVDPLRDVLLTDASVSAARVADLQRAARRTERRLTVPIRDGLTACALSSPWVTAGLALSYTITADGLVIIEGDVTGGTVSSTVATGLPPARGTVRLPAIYATAAAAVSIDTAGSLVLAGGAGSGTLFVAATYIAG